MFTLDGYKVWFQHQHHQQPFTLGPNGPLVKGTTSCHIDKEGEMVTGFAYCSAKDNFDKEAGRKVAMSQALDIMELDKEARAKFWDAYFQAQEDARQASFVDYLDAIGK